MDTLITDLRALGQHGQTVRHPESLDVAAVAGEAWAYVDTGSATLDLEEGIDRLDADRERLLQLFENLFKNAVEHAGPDVTVRVGPLDEGFYVADDGPGIPEEFKQEAFEFGYTSKGEESTGLGLAIVEAIADAHGWGLRLVDSETGGARFEFRPRWHPDMDAN
ncbi:MAG: signal transduction histidine kinase [Natronomonas sp.]|jgi:signal transduction histidine kinase